MTFLFKKCQQQLQANQMISQSGKRRFSGAQGAVKTKRSLIAPFNSNQRLLIRDTSLVREKLNHFSKKGGLENLCLLSDFDYTLTRYSLDGLNRLDASFTCIKNSRFATEEFKRISNHLYTAYHPFEKNIHIPYHEKRQKIQEWWKKDLHLISSLNLSHQSFFDMVRSSNLQFRNGIDQVLRACTHYQIPMVIVSAALSDVVEKSFDLLFEELGCSLMDQKVVHVVANASMICPQTSQVTGFKEPLIHSCNKDQIVHEYFLNSKQQKNTDLLERHNIIVMGDLTEDIKMASHLHKIDKDLLSIGFFNNPAKDGEELLEEYEKKFDIVVVNDGNLHFLHYFLLRLGHYEGKNPCPSSNLIRYEDLKDHSILTHKINELFENL